MNLLRVNVSPSVSLTPESSAFTVMIDPNEFSLMCEVKQWIQLLLGIQQTISLNYRGTQIPDNESSKIITLLGNDLEISLCQNSSHPFPILKKEATWRGIAVYSSIKKKLEEVVSTARDNVPRTEESTVPIREGQTILGNSSESGSISKKRTKKSFSIGTFVNQLRKENQHSANEDSKNVDPQDFSSPSSPEVSVNDNSNKGRVQSKFNDEQDEELYSEKKRRRVRKRGKRGSSKKEKNECSDFSEGYITNNTNQNNTISRFCMTPVPLNSRIRFSPDVEVSGVEVKMDGSILASIPTNSNDSEMKSSTPLDTLMTPVCKIGTGIPPCFVLG